jgi:hypothetical protein
MITEDEVTRHPRSFRLSREGDRLLEQLSVLLGVNRTGVVELALRALAKREAREQEGMSR